MRALRMALVVVGLLLLAFPGARGAAGAQRVEAVKRSGVAGELSQSNTGKESKRHRVRAERGEQIREIFPRDLRKKKILEHLTGPLYFSPKCRKHVYRLYHNTRDCTVPAYYKRCARLLVRLAGTPTCLES